MTVGDAFDQSVEYYDDWVRKALPGYDDLFSIALDLIPYNTGDKIRVLDLGAGTGLFSYHVLLKYPCARFVLYDLAPKMLVLAQNRFEPYQDQFEFLVDDYRKLKDDHKYHLVISSLSIHHLENDEKQALFQEVYRLLRDGGIFINIDQIKAATLELRELYWSNWLQMVRKNGASEEQIQRSIHRRTKFDRDALLLDQLQWLEEAGFSSVDCVYKNFFIGVFYAHKKGK